MLAYYYDDADVAHGVAVDEDVAFANAAYVDGYGITMMTMTMIMMVLMMMTVTIMLMAF
jgi:hypothetical protein